MTNRNGSGGRALLRQITAAGHAIKLTSQREIETFKQRAQASYWQERAWIYDEEVPEIGFAHDFTHHAMSRVRLVPAFLPDDPDEMPVPLSDTDEIPPEIDPDECRAVLSRLEPFTDYMGETARKLDTAGECHVAIVPDDDSLDGESAKVLSNDELMAKGAEWYIRQHPNDTEGVLIPPDAVLYRIWTPSGRYGELPMSPMRRLLGVAEELMLLTQVIRGQARSRVAMAGGILGIPDELTLEMQAKESDAEHDSDGELGGDTFIEDFIDMATTAMIDHESAAAAIPIILRGKSDLIEKIKQIPIGLPFDVELRNIRNELLGRIANGLDLPREVVLGVGENNHWNAEQIEHQAWHVHLEPRAMSIVAATTTAFYRPQLLAMGMDPAAVRRCITWYDPSWFIGTPDLAETSTQGLADYAISWATWRRANGYSDDDAPDQAEIDYRISIKQRERVTVRETVTETTAPIDVNAPTQMPPEDAPGGTSDQAVEDAQTAITAAGRVPLDGLGRRLVGIERDTRARLQQSADTIIGRALERAGLKVRNNLAKANADTRAKLAMSGTGSLAVSGVKTLPGVEIMRLLGPSGVTALGLHEQDLLAGALGDLEVRYRSLVSRAQRAAATAASATVEPDIPYDELDAATKDSVDSGWALLAAGITAIVAGLLFNPDPKQPDQGEFDPASVVPVGLIRAALDRAGGANVTLDGKRGNDVTPDSLQGAPAGAGATQGPVMQSLFSDTLGIGQDRYRWTYGDAPRIREFEPHLELDGVTFEDWDSDVLLNAGDFPPTDYYAPGDHDGCMCDYESLYAVDEQTAADNADQEPIDAILLGNEGSALGRTAAEPDLVGAN